VLSGVCSREAAARKLTYTVERIRVPAAREPAGQWLVWAMDQLPASDELAAAGEAVR
jgi:hypothetical protein